MRTLALLVAFAVPAHAQTIVDGSGKAIPEDVVRAAFAAVTKEFPDPISAQFKGVDFPRAGEVILRQGMLCGFVNVKNLFGGYVGFKPFFYDIKAGNSYIFDARPTDAHYRLAKTAFSYSSCRIDGL